MQKTVSILLLVAFTAQCFSRLGVIAGYEINKDYIARVLCVNRDKPAMHCNGKCYLKKKLQQDQQRKNNEAGAIGNKLDIVLFCIENPLFVAPDIQKATIHFPQNTPDRYRSPHFAFFHPPRAQA